MVDDNAVTRRLETEMLELEGYRVIAPPGGRAALNAVEQEIPDLVLLDIMMPGLDGQEVCRRISEACQIPVIVVTESKDVADKAKAFEEGADDYITKPFSARVLAARVKAVLRRTLPGRERPKYPPSLGPTGLVATDGPWFTLGSLAMECTIVPGRPVRKDITDVVPRV